MNDSLDPFDREQRHVVGQVTARPVGDEVGDDVERRPQRVVSQPLDLGHQSRVAELLL